MTLSVWHCSRLQDKLHKTVDQFDCWFVKENCKTNKNWLVLESEIVICTMDFPAELFFLNIIDNMVKISEYFKLSC